ncbi:hypothetical protein ACUH7Y_07125 [Clostridium beijerinckii]|uniref:Uncharacterized protein n=1 Tax=Clostridium beijerinckii TaxID=1520 RepID=A0A7X9SQS0_CLOBE|nr:hypothetical protein [Clostridium beijerinckii]NMF06249.1 hypothetical protein [Clostridium beijerinckii]
MADYLLNVGRLFPLRQETRDGVQTALSDADLNIMKNCILDCKVYGARPNKYYRIQWIGNGWVNAYARYDILISEYDKSTYTTNSASGKVDIIPLTSKATGKFAPTKNIETVIVKSLDGAIVVEVTIDYSVLTTANKNLLDMGGMSYIIDENCYIPNMKTNALKVDFTNASSPIANVFSSKYRFDFRKEYNNQLFGWWQTSKKDTSFNTPLIFTDTDDGVTSFGIATDMIGPYIATAVNNGVDGATRVFCGGQHSSDNSTTNGSPTAENRKIDFWVDGTNIINTGIYFGDKIDIYVVNAIMSYNTIGLNRYTHLEYVHYSISNGKINVTVDIKPLEHIRVEAYYGMQMVNTDYTYIQFIGGDTGTKRVLIAPGVEGAQKGTLFYDTVIFNNNNHNDVLEMHMDNGYGLGQRTYIDDNQSLCFIASGKTYMRLCGFYGNTKSFDMFPNKIYSWRGYYWFKTRY